MSAIPASVQRWLCILMPPISILVCCFVMVPRHKKLQQVNQEIKGAQTTIAGYLQQLQAISNLPPDPTIATMPFTKKEQSDFLRGVSTLCSRTGNRILAVHSLAAPPAAPPPPPGASPPPAAPGALPADVITIRSTIMFEGSFHSLRTFLAGLQRSRRLISLTECRVGAGSEGYPHLQTTLIVARYVDSPGAAVPEPGPAAVKS